MDDIINEHTGGEAFKGFDKSEDEDGFTTVRDNKKGKSTKTRQTGGVDFEFVSTTKDKEDPLKSNISNSPKPLTASVFQQSKKLKPQNTVLDFNESSTSSENGLSSNLSNSSVDSDELLKGW